jgi:Glyoxalase/Bleomycin resistance protein/Dioxygenase superfamily
MLSRVDHIGYVARELAEGIATFGTVFDLAVTVELELPEFSVRAAFMRTDSDSVSVEVVEFRNPVVAEARLGGLPMRLDHVAFEVEDLEWTALQLRATGVELGGPDGSELLRPLELNGARHLWTVPGAGTGVCFQLIERVPPLSSQVAASASPADLSVRASP